MKALQLVPAMNEGGVERYNVTLDAVLRGAGWENRVVTKDGTLLGDLVRVDLKSKNPLTAPWRAWRLRQVLKAEKPDVVGVHSRVPGWLFRLANTGLDIPFISFAHGANSVSAYSRVMTRGAKVWCPSTFVRDYLKANYHLADDRFAVIPHAVDLKRFDPAHLDRAFMLAQYERWRLRGHYVVMAVGRITPLKGYDTLIRAVSGMKDVKLVIVGSAEPKRAAYHQSLQDLVAGLGIGGQVIFAGGQEKIPECLSLADVVVSSNTTKPESFGLSMAEALAMERPVIARAFGGALDIVRDGVDGILVPEASDYTVAFRAAIERARDTRFTNLRAGVAARFDYDQMAKATVRLFEEVAG